MCTASEDNGTMAEAVTIEQADALNRDTVLVSLSDGRVLVLTLAQILSADPRLLPLDEPDEDSN